MILGFDDVWWSIDGTPVLAHVRFALERRELAVMVGPSGAGKSSVLRLAAGLAEPSGGRVETDARRIAVVFQEPRLLPWETAVDNAGIGLSALGIGRREARPSAERWLARLGFRADDMAKRPDELSGGMRARVALARAFVVEPDLVLLDEPFAALDPGLRRDLQRLIRTLVDETGAAALFVTHDLPEAVRLADRILLLAGRPGRVVADTPMKPVADPAEVWRAAADLARRPAFAVLSGGLAGPDEPETRP